MNKHVVVIVPTYNEQENIDELLEETLKTTIDGYTIEICIIDDQSTDGTAALAKKWADSTPSVHIVAREGPRGRGLAGIEGYLWALSRGADLICELDADLSHPPRYIAQLLDATVDSDVVIGSRFAPGGCDQRQWYRRGLTRLANKLVSLGLGLGLMDPHSGYRCFRREALESIQVATLRCKGPDLLQEVIFRCHRAGLRIQEVGVAHVRRERGESKLRIHQLFEGCTAIFKLRFYESHKWGRPLVPSCSVCEGRRGGAYAPRFYEYADKTYDLVRCLGCGLVRVLPLPDVSEVAQFYDEAYFEEDYDSLLSEKSYFASEARLRKKYAQILDLLERRCPKRGSFLDIGCAAGYFLDVANERGWKSQGIEISSAAAEQAKGDVLVGTLESLEQTLKGETFDLIHCGHTLEHMVDPGEFVARASQYLKPGGILALEVPTYINSFYFRTLKFLAGWWKGRYIHRAASSLLYTLKLQNSPRCQPPYHLYEFSPTTLCQLVERFELQVLEVHQSVARFGAASSPIRWLFSGMDQLARRGWIPGGQTMVICRRLDGLFPEDPTAREM